MLHKTRGKNNGGASPLINIGYNNVVMKDRIVAIISPNSAPVKRLKEEAGKRMKLVDATQGRRTRAIIITDSEHVVLSAVALETIIQRFNNDEETATA